MVGWIMVGGWAIVGELTIIEGVILPEAVGAESPALALACLFL